MLSNSSLRLRAAALVASLLPSAPVLATTTTVRTFAVPGRASLQLDVPIRWRDAVEWSRDGRRVTLRFASAEADAFAMQVVPLAGEADVAAPITERDRVRQVVEDGARTSLGLPPDADLRLEELRREDGGAAFVYTVTDPDMPVPPPLGSFRVMTQGAVMVGDYLVTTTILTQDPFSDELADALAVLRTARTTDDEPDPHRLPGTPPDPRGRLGARYDLDIPEGFTVRQDNPLVLEHAATGATFSVAVADARGHWKSELRSLRDAAERRLTENMLFRRSGPRSVAGREGGEMLYVNMRDDLEVHQVVVALPDMKLTTTWQVPVGAARRAAALEQRILDTLVLVP